MMTTLRVYSRYCSSNIWAFPWDDIKEMTLRNTDSDVMSESLHMQLGLVEERIEQMKLMKSALQEASEVIDEGRSVDWSHMLELVNI